ncbi:EAL domain-containing protein [Acinetobacter bohemicus]|uniref:putative bifunctional diguanylate cyclase/phosphodiesterase n=1 Tax=Acinetobacter TaxID=469 RepID=UPI00209B9798|nr:MULTISPECIES: EAL domain-containing protein [Acinetobacter]MCO8041487.1 EAL domain-containing protein [Acinetobacter sp. S4400-12]MCU7223822.1 EAL domain-containing protein [Acinetobacter bohemicus]
MMDMHYDVNLALGSALMALVMCYFAVSFEQKLLGSQPLESKKMLILGAGALFTLAIWSVHFIGLVAGQWPVQLNMNFKLNIISCLIAFTSSSLAVWLISCQILPLARLLLSAIVMGLGIAGLHYISMRGLSIDHYNSAYDPLVMLCSVLVAIAGSGLSFWIVYKYRYSNSPILIRFMAASFFTLSLIGLHYGGMAGASLSSGAEQLKPINSFSVEVLLALALISSLILLGALSVAIWESRLNYRNLQLAWANKEIENRGIQDTLTQLPNRLYLTEYVQQLFSAQQPQQKFAFLYIDLDRFKAVNDVFGHLSGDQLLIQFSHRIDSLLDEHTQLLRIGGDEFLLVMENTAVEQASNMAEQILEQIQDGFLINGKTINISASIGIALYPQHGTNLQDLLVNADTAMLNSKYQGRNTYSLFNCSSEQHENKSQSKLINDLYKAVEEQQFILFYQPKFNCDDQICGVEALIRWQHPLHGLLEPSMFIGGAEKTGLVIQIGYWVLEQACKQIQLWEKSKTDFFPLAVNLSAVQFEHKHLCSTLEQLLKKYAIQPGHLMIEITETTAMHYIDASIRTLEQLRNMGIQLAIDDFGTGHSSFLYLKNLSVDELKIDKEFIQGLTEGSKEEMILESIIQLANKLGLKVTAEGVETKQQANILIRLGCQQMQGYLLGKPMTVEQLEACNFLGLD